VQGERQSPDEDCLWLDLVGGPGDGDSLPMREDDLVGTTLVFYDGHYYEPDWGTMRAFWRADTRMGYGD